MVWEYKTVLTGGARTIDTQSLNKLGMEGWELISFIYHAAGGQMCYIFKRPVITH